MNVIRFPNRHPIEQTTATRYYGALAAIILANIVITIAAVYGAIIFLTDLFGAA